MTDLSAQYFSHLDTLTARLARALEGTGKEGILVPSGRPKYAFLDDHTYPFKVNPHFKAWLPLTDLPDSFLLVRPGEKPLLFYNQPADYWHKPPANPSGFWTDAWDIEIIRTATDIENHNRIGGPQALAFIGEETDIADRMGIDHVNDPSLLARIHFDRAYKTDYELISIQDANRIAARGHLAAERMFRDGASEFEIATAYLHATGAREKETPYTSIVALNENCAVLHYQFYEHARPETPRSFLIDAGAECRGYAADVTRTHAYGKNEFAELIERMDDEQRAIIAAIEPGMNYAELHEKMHYRVGGVLKDFKLVDMDVSSMVEAGLTFNFLPHGLGHLLGLQTHDVGGLQQNSKGQMRAAPERYPALRLTRPIEERQVFTVEPGLYFIPLLLAALKETPEGKTVDWNKIEQLAPYGGIRIEDNVAIVDGNPANLTRQAFSDCEQEYEEVT